MLQHVGAEKLFAKLMDGRRQCKRKSEPATEKARVTPLQGVPTPTADGS